VWNRQVHRARLKEAEAPIGMPRDVAVKARPL
jgi:hypothetical protein